MMRYAPRVEEDTVWRGIEMEFDPKKKGTELEDEGIVEYYQKETRNPTLEWLEYFWKPLKIVFCLFLVAVICYFVYDTM